VWACNWPAFDLFSKVGKQWRVGFNGREGLDYNVVFHLMDRMGLDAKHWDWLFEDIRVLEEAALQTMRKPS